MSYSHRFTSLRKLCIQAKSRPLSSASFNGAAVGHPGSWTDCGGGRAHFNPVVFFQLLVHAIRVVDLVANQSWREFVEEAAGKDLFAHDKRRRAAAGGDRTSSPCRPSIP